MQILLWFLGPIGRYVLIAIAVAGSWLWIKVHYENIGYQKAIYQISKNTKEAKDVINKAVSDTAACFARGGTPDDTTGVCDR